MVSFGIPEPSQSCSCVKQYCLQRSNICLIEYQHLPLPFVRMILEWLFKLVLHSQLSRHRQNAAVVGVAKMHGSGGFSPDLWSRDFQGYILNWWLDFYSPVV